MSMFLRPALVVLLSMAIAAPFACAAMKKADDSPKKVLLINAVEPELTHSHMGLTVFTNGNRKIGNDWRMDLAYAEAAARLLAEAGHTVHPVEAPAEVLPALRDWSFMKSGWSDYFVRPEYASWFKDEMNRHNATVAVVLWEHKATLSHTSSSTYEGYGFFTMRGDPPGLTAVFANIGIIAVSGEKLVQLKPAPAIHTQCFVRLDFARFGKSSAKNVSADDLLPYQDAIRRIGERSILVGLEAAGLTQRAAPPCESIRLPEVTR